MPIDNVVGRAFVVSWPISHWAWLDNYPEVFDGRRRGGRADDAVPSAPTCASNASCSTTGAPLVIACDEVGRGALAGPVAVGMVVIDRRACARMPAGLRDSKLVTEPRREAMAPARPSWVRSWAVGEASAAEIDELGIMACLGLAGARALAALELPARRDRRCRSSSTATTTS